MHDKALIEILACGQRHGTTMLLPYWIPEQLTSDWRPAFDFFLGRACYQGRRDDVSQKVDDATREVLAASLYAAPDWSDPTFAKFRALLGERVGAGIGKAGKARDVEMVISERLGHATVSITLDTYSHAIPALHEEAAERIAGLVLAEG